MKKAYLALVVLMVALAACSVGGKGGAVEQTADKMKSRHAVLAEI